jgi:hypothetical protein
MNLVQRWRAFDPAWRYALIVFAIARISLTLWSLVVMLMFQRTVYNLNYKGEPVLAVFDLASSERFLFARTVDDRVLTFRAGLAGTVQDAETGSVWALGDGRAVQGAFTGSMLKPSQYSAEVIFPYLDSVPDANIVFALWQRFDTNWYLSIATNGYVYEGSTVYLPAYPLLIRMGTMLTGNPIFSALLVSNFALLGVLVLLYRITQMQFGDASARRSVVYLVMFPTGFFLLAAYTESLFVLFALAALMFAQRDRWIFAAMCGVCAALTRLQGVLLVVPLGWLAWTSFRKSQWQRTWLDRHANFFWLGLIPLSTVIFLSVTSLSLISVYQAELHAVFVSPWDNVITAFAQLTQFQSNWVVLFNLLVTLGMIIMLGLLFQQMPREYALYALMMILAPLFRMTTAEPLVSMARYAITVFPMFMLLAVWGKNPWVNRMVVYLSFLLQLYVCAQFVLWGWVG